MTASGRPQGDEPGLEQEGIWDGPRPDAGPEPAEATSDRLTKRLTTTTRSPGPAGLLYAEVPNRVMALILDIIVLSVIGFALAWLFGGLVSDPGALDSAGGELDIGAFIIVVGLQAAFSVAYFAGCWSQLGWTPGMRLLGIRIGHESDGRPLSRRQGLVRWLLLGLPALLATLAIYVPNAIGLILGALGAVWLAVLLYSMAQSPTRQGLHDRYAHTILFKDRRRAA